MDYAYQARFDAKPGVLIPHLKKHCFVFYDLVHEDNLNYLPRYDPVTSVKPSVEKLRRMCDIIASSQLDHLELKYDPKDQQIIEDCWVPQLGEASWKFHQRFGEVVFKKDAAMLDKIEDFKESAGGFVRRLVVEKKEEAESEESDDLIPFNVEFLDKDQMEKVDADDFKFLFKT